MIKHIVLWKLKSFAEGRSKEQNRDIMKRDLLALKETIPQIRSLEVGTHLFPSDASAWDIALYSAFENEQDLQAYQKHPDHVKVAEFIGKVRESRAVVDYKVE